MRYAVISDIHANLTALQAVLKDAAECGVDRIVCLGDVVGYGPQPAEALRRVRESAALTLAGNHDDAVSGRMQSEDFVELAADAVARHREALDEGALAWLKELPYVCEFGGAVAAHGDFTDPPRFYYVANEEDARANFEANDHQLMFVGHTHEPGVFLTGASGQVYRLDMQDFALEDGKRYIVNLGSVGYPRERNGDCRSTYVIYDADAREIFFRSLPFQVSGMLQRGTNPRRIRRGVIAGMVAAVAIAAGVIAYMVAPRTEVQEDPALELACKSLILPSRATHVNANLKLASGTCPVELRIIFKSAAGERLGTEVKTVKESACGKVKVPSGTVAADFAIRRRSAADVPRVIRFEPEYVVKGP